MTGLPNLQNLRLRQNRLTGTVPFEILNSGKLLCFDASGNQMDNDIPQGECVVGANEMRVACDEENDPTCSCCSCWRDESSIEYCRRRLY